MILFLECANTDINSESLSAVDSFTLGMLFNQSDFRSVTNYSKMSYKTLLELVYMGQFLLSAESIVFLKR